jgi:alkaline phosphatase D
LRIAKLGFRQYQWSHSPRNGPLSDPPPGWASIGSHASRHPTPHSAGEFPLWYQFEASGFPVFVMDTRSERDGHDAARPTGHGARLVSDRQIDALEAWLITTARAEATRTRPKFIVSGSVLFPLTCETAREAAYACRDDGWHGYPGTRNRVLKAILDHDVQNVVFIAGDAHCASSARVRLTDGTKWVNAYCITSSALYAPLPFANSKPHEYVSSFPSVASEPVPRARLDLGGGCSAEYTLAYKQEAFVTARNFTQVTITRNSTDWTIEAMVYGEDGTELVRKEPLRPPRPTQAEKRAAPQLQGSHRRRHDDVTA